MKEFESITVEFKDQNKLCLEKKSMSVYHFKPDQEVYALYYLEVEINENNGVVYNTNNIEYFPLDMLNTALAAFNTRLRCNNPIKETEIGMKLTEFLEKE